LSETPPETGKLAGVRVVDLSQFLPGPMLTLMMADQGAEVVKVEPPAGDPARAMAPFEAGQSVWFRNLNRGKRSERLDLKSDEGRQRLWALIDAADVLVEGFRPGVMARLGFGWEACATRNPRLVYCSISAFGQTGVLAHHPAHDMAVQALSGFLSVNDGPDGAPVVPGVPSADMAAGLTGLAAVLMALYAAQRTGRGDYIDCAMFDALLPWSAHVAGEALMGGEPPRSASQRSLGGAALYNVYATSDGRHVVLAGREEKFARALFDGLGQPDLVAVALREPGEQSAAIDFLRETFATRTRDDWEAWFEGRDIAFAAVLDFAEALARPHVAERGLVIDHAGAHQFAPAIRFASSRWEPADAPA
jgi:crotonobetainyl-CoA:carnitine CoA-transferase CaiB-like acyl-CoA transferase